VAREKQERLKSLLRSYGSCLVAYSGGVDSAFLAWVASGALPDSMLAVIADSPSLPRSELEDAQSLARRWRIPLRVIRTDEFSNVNYVSNPVNRCFFCKQELFTQMVSLAKREGFSALAYGENASDASDFRPGGQAAKEAFVHAPLREVGLTKEDIRALSAAAGLPTADKPAMPCLSSRIPHGEPVTVEKLYMVERAEARLRARGLSDVRVRHHQLSQGSLARIELGDDEIQELMDPAIAQAVAAELRVIGYDQVTLDLRGYRSSGRQAGRPVPAIAVGPSPGDGQPMTRGGDSRKSLAGMDSHRDD